MEKTAATLKASELVTAGPSMRWTIVAGAATTYSCGRHTQEQEVVVFVTH